jgi:nitrogenase molybdenum-iron protein NifN
MPLIHGGQGCSTYIRRYLIGHFREVVDIASTNFSEASTIFGGSRNLLEGLANLTAQYQPAIIGVSTSCLSETMGEDVRAMLLEWKSVNRNIQDQPELVHVSTPSYKGSQRDGFYDAVKAILEQLVETVAPWSIPLPARINVLPGFVSSEDIRHLVEITASFGLDATILPDYSQTLDDGQWESWQAMPSGGTPLERIRTASQAQHTFDFEIPLHGQNTAGVWLEKSHHVPCSQLALPIGIAASDAFFSALSIVSEQPISDTWLAERGRLADSYIDAHKYAFGMRVAIVGDEELVAALARFVAETGIIPVLCATGGSPERLRQGLQNIETPEDIFIVGAADYEEITELCKVHNVGMIIGNSKAYSVARELQIPLVRCGFPIQDRMGGQRLLHVGYRGTQRLFDQIINTWLEYQQDHSTIGYKTY